MVPAATTAFSLASPGFSGAATTFPLSSNQTVVWSPALDRRRAEDLFGTHLCALAPLHTHVGGSVGRAVDVRRQPRALDYESIDGVAAVGLLIGGAHTRFVDQRSRGHCDGKRDERGDEYAKDYERFESIDKADQRVEPESAQTPANRASKRCDASYIPCIGISAVSRKHFFHGDTGRTVAANYVAPRR